MAPIRVAFTAAGAPQAATLVRQLRTNGEREVHLIALDMRDRVVGSFLADDFYRIPEAGSVGYGEALLRMAETLEPDAILNCSENDAIHIARLAPELESRGCTPLCSSPQSIAILTNKLSLYQAVADLPEVEVPQWRLVHSLDEFAAVAREMGYPEKDVCFKPPVSKGSRGFRILTERFSRRDLLLNHKPISRYITLDDVISIFSGDLDFPNFLVMEVAVGEETDCMNIGLKGRPLLSTVKTRESARWGVIDSGELVDRPRIRAMMEAIVRRLELSYNSYFQFIGGKLIEMGPRTSTYIYHPKFIEPWISIKLALGLISPDEVAELQTQIPVGRRMVRYMDQLFYDASGSWSN
jgi:carbamoyl-phosphate synthase large subunit